MSPRPRPTTTARGKMWRGVIETYRPYLPVSSKTPIVTLLEGNTPLIHSRAL
ncbi:MAG: threonine synthase, partial [Candidatus Omnitrophica bacterium]|nr:threonine synthase [Candidatus Omnitrophota bacterium]